MSEERGDTFDFYGIAELPMWVKGVAAIGEWLVVIFMALVLVYALMQATIYNQKIAELQEELRVQGCIAVYESPMLNLSGSDFQVDMNATGNGSSSTSPSTTSNPANPPP